jgi:two-component system CheB/CheR fusion protein
MEKNLKPGDYEHKFMECDERFEAIFGLSSAASKVIDSNLTILKVNQALTELMG